MRRRTLRVLTWPYQKARPYFVCFRTATEKAEGESWKNKDSGPIGLEGYCTSPQWLKTKTHYWAPTKCWNRGSAFSLSSLSWFVFRFVSCAKVMGKSPMKILLKGSCAAKGLPVPWISHFATAFGLPSRCQAMSSACTWGETKANLRPPTPTYPHTKTHTDTLRHAEWETERDTRRRKDRPR